MNDLISRQAVLDKAYAYGNGLEPDGFCVDVEDIQALPSAQPERKTGKWIHHAKYGRIECDQCGKVYRNTFAPKHYCPNCGADMREKE